jgi:hypothetical protein
VAHNIILIIISEFVFMDFWMDVCCTRVEKFADSARLVTRMKEVSVKGVKSPDAMFAEFLSNHACSVRRVSHSQLHQLILQQLIQLL